MGGRAIFSSNINNENEITPVNTLANKIDKNAKILSQPNKKLLASLRDFEDSNMQLEDDIQLCVSQVFSHYCSLGDPLNRANMSSCKFCRFLKDVGLLSDPRRNNKENKNKNNKISQVDADLIFLQACNFERKERNDLKSQQQRHMIKLGSFCRALNQVIVRSFPNDTNFEDAYVKFYSQILRPLSEEAALTIRDQSNNYPSNSSFDVSKYAIEMGKKEMVDLFSSSSVADGMRKIFHYYTDHSAKANFGATSWNMGNFLRFASDFEITEELNHLLLQKVFQDCAQVEYESGPRENDNYTNKSLIVDHHHNRISRLGFQLALVLIAVKLNRHECLSLFDQVVGLFHRMNNAIGMKERLNGVSQRSSMIFAQLPSERNPLAAVRSRSRQAMNAAREHATWASVVDLHE